MPGVESFSTRIVPAQPRGHGSAIDAQIQIRTSWVYSAEMWAAIEPTQSHQVDGEKRRGASVTEHKRGLPRVPVRRIYVTFNRLYTWSMGPFVITNRGGLTLWLF